MRFRSCERSYGLHFGCQIFAKPVRLLVALTGICVAILCGAKYGGRRREVRSTCFIKNWLNSCQNSPVRLSSSLKGLMKQPNCCAVDVQPICLPRNCAFWSCFGASLSLPSSVIIQNNNIASR